LPRFDVTLAGETNLDIILYGLAEDLPLEQEFLADDMMVTLGGSTSITAHNLSVLGSKVGLITRVGSDPLGAIALDRLRAAGVDLSCITHSTKFSTGLSVLLQHAARRRILTYAGAMGEMSFADLDLEYLASARHFHLCSFFLQRGWVTQIPQALRQLKRAGLTISLDTNDDPADRWGDGIHEALRFVDIFLPNEREACKIAGVDDVEEALLGLAERVPNVVVKLGMQGAMAISKGHRYSAPAEKVQVVDAVGAGDSFNAGFLHRYLAGGEFGECLAAGNASAALSTTRPGGTEAFRERVLQRVQGKP
jgi:sugar/nucleoside kinase (ribokinase family)